MLIGLGGLRAKLPPRVERAFSRAVYKLGELLGEWDGRTVAWHHPVEKRGCWSGDGATACLVCQVRLIRHTIRLNRERRGRDPYPDAPNGDGDSRGSDIGRRPNPVGPQPVASEGNEPEPDERGDGL